MEEKEVYTSSFTMDYEKNEIILTVYAEDSQPQTRLTEKDVLSMMNWFKIAKFK